MYNVELIILLLGVAICFVFGMHIGYEIGRKQCKNIK